ncbi:MAG: hypothetical protein EOO90_13175 [Pedobacter sp.]|nr:MAG: hypothetical protein EOO90_13175 [Pedobacter sp.]
MGKLFTIIFCLNAMISLGQTNPEEYKFSKDILSQIDKDTVAWKYQTGATELSFSGYYKEVLKIWDKNGVRKLKPSTEDSLYFTNCTKINAKDYIIKQSKNSQIVIINEAHHIPRHRTVTKSLLKDLYDNGYRYLGLEALSDSKINQRKFAVVETGYYTKEPEFGNLISEALKIGFILFGYEADDGKNGKEREIQQAKNIQKFIKSNPSGKVLIHCGYAHAYENEYPSWGKAMAGRLRDNMNIDPFTIDQTMLLESSEDIRNHMFIKLNTHREPIVLIGDDGQVFNGKGTVRQTDVVVIHPQTEYVDNRPDWLLEGKKRYTVLSNKLNSSSPYLVLAYRRNENEHDGIPADIIEITGDKPTKDLYLETGIYTIVIKDKDYKVIDKYTVEIK